MVKNLPAFWETRIRSLGWEDPLEKGVATHSNILARRIPWTEEPGGLESLGSKRVRHNWVTNTLTSSLEGIFFFFFFFFNFEKYNANGYVYSPSLCLLPQPHSMRYLDSWSTSTANTTLGEQKTPGGWEALSTDRLRPDMSWDQGTHEDNDTV